MQYSAMKTIGVVAQREMAVALKSKMVVGTMLLLILGAIIAPIAINFFSGDDKPDSVAIVGMEASAFDDSGIDATEAKDRAEAQQLVENDEADAALVPAESDGWDLLSKGDTPAAVTTTVNQIVSSQAQATALDTLNIDPQELEKATPSTTVNQVSLEEEDGTEQKMAGVATVLIGAMVVVFSVMTFAGLIGGRVTEEKSSRVVEIILSSVRPVDFLAGKILGNTIIGFLATLLILGGGAISLAATGLASDIELDYGLVAVLLVGEILGLLFFGSLYAAAGSMVQRTEDLQSTQAPILFLVFATMYVPMFGWMHLDATWMQVMTWLPPVSMLVAPLQVAGGNLSWLGLAASYLLMGLATALIIVIVGRIYRRAILNNGRKMTWRQALSK
ncbi:ABC transporter permease [Corynebacterium sp. c8Ua_181]|uniref:ABC transporter permease n=1 Tax=Corynebacterium curieae TaxID=2913500 RepID=A0A9X3MB35_9CORY|nr:ABC transporter permease [Corynebacterium curieae]MCZ9306773.1 ABC transporter permease [Corynebacterium curieae]MDV2423621.1 ABC transporter permease [Corynebacterium curieae]